MTILKEDFDKEYEKSKTKVTVEEYEKLSSKLLFEIIRHDGEKELERHSGPLFFSALAAGIMVSFSFYFRAVLAMYAGTAPYADAISGIGSDISKRFAFFLEPPKWFFCKAYRSVRR